MATTGFLFDANSCTGCQACELGCTIENRLPWGESWRQVSTFNAEHAAPAPLFHISLACNHCLDAPCMRHCPALAIRRQPDTGAVLIDEDRCIGCGYCSWACPYDAPVYDSGSGVMTKCTLCDERLRAGLSPACVDACPTGALGYGSLGFARLDEATGVDSLPGFPQSDIRPRIRFKPLASGREEPERRAWPSPATAATWPPVPQRQNRPAVNLASEWPLLVFTLVFACLVAFHAALLTDGRPILGLPFLGVCLAAMGISTLHLGRRARAWRAVLNLRGSWLSREIAAFGAFVGLAGAWHLSAMWEIDGPAVRFLPWAALYAGLIGLYSVDRVYDLASTPYRLATGAGEKCRPALRQGRPLPHSASVLWTGTLAVALLLGSPGAAGVLLGLKLLVYLRRRLGRDRGAAWTADLASPPSRFWNRWSLGARLSLSVLGFGVWWSLPGDLSVLGLGLILAGEIVDRCEFYQELEFMSPARQIARELRSLTC